MDLAYEALGAAAVSAPNLRAEPPLAAAVRRAREMITGPARRLLVPVAVVSAVSAVGTVTAPMLVDAPLLLAALSPRIPFLVLAASRTDLPLFLLVAVPRLLLTDPLYFLLGRQHGAAALALLPGAKGRLARIAAVSAPLLVLVRPIGRHLALAGAGRSRAWIVAAADVASTVIYLVTLHAAGTAALR